jgi:sugar lactone lactonase YvrE
MRHLLVILLLATFPAAAAEPLWEASGFANPESVLWDPAKKVLYVSNINGAPLDKDGNGYISKLSQDGKLLAEKWAMGLDGPKGMAVFKGRLYVSDIDRLVEIDSNTGKITKAYPAAGAKFLNDVTVDDKGAVYVSDMLTNTIWRLTGGKFESWLMDPQLQNPNGLKAESSRLVVAAWGPMTGEGFATKAPGGLKAVTFADKMIRDLTLPFGNLDGLESDGKGGWLVSDWVAGTLFQLDRRGQPTTLIDLPPGSADIGTIPEKGIVLVPLMMDGKVQAYGISPPSKTH